MGPGILSMIISVSPFFYLNFLCTETVSIKVDEKILEEFKNSSRHNFNIKVDEVIRPKIKISIAHQSY